VVLLLSYFVNLYISKIKITLVMKKVLLSLIVLITISKMQAQNYVFNTLPINSAGNPFVTEAVALGNNVIFSAFSVDNNVGKELFISDGTPAGTKLLKDIWPGGGDGNPINLKVVGNKVFFTATDPVYGTSVWETNGTANGTVIWSQTNPVGLNPNGYPAFGFTAVGNNGAIVYYRYDGATNFYDLVYDDGSQTGPQVLLSNPTGDVVDPNDFLGDESPNKNIINYNGEAFLSATNGSTGKLLWHTDGFSITSFSEQQAGLNQNYFTIMNNNLYFLKQGNGPTSTKSLYRYDGSSTFLVTLNNFTSSSISFLDGLFTYNNNLFFYYSQGGLNTLNKSDGFNSASLKIIKSSTGGGLNVAGLNHGLNNVQCNGKILCPAYNLSGSIGEVAYFNGDSTFTPVSDISSQSYTYLRHNRCVGNENYLAAYSYSGSTIVKSSILTTGPNGSGVIDLEPALASNANPLDPASHFKGFTKAGNKIFFMANFQGNDWQYYSLENKSGTAISGNYNILPKLKVYPNPAQTQLHFTNSINANQFSITDIFGKTLIKSGCAQNDNSINIGDLPSGLYNLSLHSAIGVQTVRFIKQ
jgi:ELWxxDGT repeat protein